MDQRNETFVPHVLAITTGTTVDFPELRQVLPQRLFALEDASRSISGAMPPAARGRSASIARHRARVLRHPFAHERVHPGLQPSVLRADRRRRALPHRQRAARHLQRHRLERGHFVRAEAGDACPTAASPSWTSRCDEAAVVAAEPDLPGERAARGAVHRRRHLPGQRPRHRGSRADAAARDRRRRARWSTTCARPAPRRSRRWRGFIADAPPLKAAVDTNDPPTVQDIAERLPGPGEVEPAARHQQGRRRAGDGRRRRPHRRDRLEPAGDPRRPRRPRDASACCRSRTACCSW